MRASDLDRSRSVAGLGDDAVALGLVHLPADEPAVAARRLRLSPSAMSRALARWSVDIASALSESVAQ